MDTTKSFWIWFPNSRRWVPATELGARTNFIIYGQDVRWSGRKPASAGCDPCDFDPLFRPDRWNRFLALCHSRPRVCHRVDCVA